jgi:membrane dipeptidase
LKEDFRIIDLHCDTILRIMGSDGKAVLKRNDLNVDIEKMNKGNYMAQFFAMYVDLQDSESPLNRCLKMIDTFYCELDKNQDEIRLARNTDELLSNDEEGKMSAFLTIEEGGTLEGRIHNLRNFYRLGVRLITLTWNYPNEIGYPNREWEYADRGLTSFGQEVVDEMNNLGMIVDVSHLSDAGFYDVAKLSKKPFAASHSDARAVKGHSRNLTDHMIKTLSEKGGVMGINFEKSFLGDAGESRIEDMVRHIKHIRNVGGIDVISIGTDFDGITQQLEIRNAGEMDKLIDGLMNENFTDSDIEKIMHKNTLRLIKDVMK